MIKRLVSLYNKDRLASDSFRQLSRLYFIALGTIALSIVVSQVLVQKHLRSQEYDSRVVNLAGRQRMLSQKLCKEMLLLAKNNRVDQLALIRATKQRWERVHKGLQQGDASLQLPVNNSPVIADMFGMINPVFQQISAYVDTVIVLSTNEQAIDSVINRILLQEPVYLQSMDAIVNQLDKEAKEKVSWLQSLELLLLFVGLGILFVELLFLFQPLAFEVQQTMHSLNESKQKTAELAEKTEQLYKEKEDSLKELQILHQALDQTALFASISQSGKIRQMSRQFATLLQCKPQELQGDFADLMSIHENERENIRQIIRNARNSLWNGVVELTNQAGEKVWLQMSIIPINSESLRVNLLILCHDITVRMRIQHENDGLKEERFQEEIRQQKMRAVQILEGQEGERKRIARDIHDGIGQMLTGLRFTLQSIDISKPEKIPAKLETINQIAGDLIRGVRIATFNLTPPELTDYGVAPALAKLAEELSRLTRHPILFHNRTNFDERLPPTVETNLYRIAQEAVNNAVKYARASYIMVTLAHSDELLSLVVQDDGVGFDPKTLENGPSEDGSGLGIHSMQERVHFINGRLFIQSAPNHGCQITVNVKYR